MTEKRNKAATAARYKPTNDDNDQTSVAVVLKIKCNTSQPRRSQRAVVDWYTPISTGAAVWLRTNIYF